MSKFSRVVIYPKDVAAITGKNYRSSWILLSRIKSHLQKESHQVVTVQEFCEYMGINEEVVCKLIS
jgi:predicted transcriptional regulator of viral defense system